MNGKTNNDFILRENLAVERTSLANERTLLSFIRTSLYFAIAGISISSFMDFSYRWVLEIGFIVISILLLGIGTIKYRRIRIKLNESRKSIGVDSNIEGSTRPDIT